MAPPISNWHPTAEELVYSWMAFRKLYKRGVVIVGCGANTGFKAYTYWGVKGWYSDEKVIKRMLSDPYDYFIAYNFGVDLLGSTSYHCIYPGDLPAILLKHDGRSIDEIVAPESIARIVESVSDTLQRNDKYEPKSVPKDPSTQDKSQESKTGGKGCLVTLAALSAIAVFLVGLLCS